MKQDADREKFIAGLVTIMRHHGFTYEIVVKKKPKGLRIIHEVTQEYLNEINKKTLEHNGANQSRNEAERP